MKQLEKDGLISRKVHGTPPPVKVIYSLTDLGITLIPVMEAVNEWGKRLVAEKGKITDFQDH